MSVITKMWADTGFEIVKISSVPEKEKFMVWLGGQTLPWVEDEENPLDWAYKHDYDYFIRGLKVTD